MRARAHKGFVLLLILVVLPACGLATRSFPPRTRLPPTRLMPAATAGIAPSGEAVAVATSAVRPTPLATSAAADAATFTPMPTGTALPSATPTHSIPWPDIRPHYTLTAIVDYEAHFVHVRQSVTITNTSAAPWSEVVLHVAPAYWPGIFLLDGVQFVSGETITAVEPSWDVTMMHVALPEPLAPGQAGQVRLQYGLALPELDPNGWGPTGNAGWGAELMQMGDWYAALVPYHEEEGWQTWVYWPVGDPVRSIIADFDVTVVAPPDVVVVAAGRDGSQDGTHHFRLRRARAFAFLASPNYTRYETESDGIAIRVFVLVRHADAGPVVSTSAAQSLALFEERFGPYPYEELIIAENGFLTAMEYPALISLSGYAFTAYEGSPDSLLVSITAHEVAHQWWYGAVGSDQVHEAWLDEALAMFSELIFYERIYPELVDWWWFYRVERWEPAGTVDVATTEYADSATFVHDMYGVAAQFMVELRETMGPEALDAFLKAYYAKHRYGWATADDFFGLATEFAPSEQLRALAAVYFAEMPQALAR